MDSCFDIAVNKVGTALYVVGELREGRGIEFKGKGEIEPFYTHVRTILMLDDHLAVLSTE